MRSYRSAVSRRSFLKSATAASVAAAGWGHAVSGGAQEQFPPVRVITRGPKYHWFGYYDKLQFDPTDRYALSMQVDFEHRSPTADDRIQIGMIDLADDDRWIELGQSNAWGWQQGCMLQWLPESDREILWNDRQEDRYVCRILDVNTREQRTIDTPIYAVSPDGRTAISTDFRRIADVRPGYGYAGLADPFANERAPSESGVWRVDLQSGSSELIVSIADVVRFGQLPADATEAKHYFNHLLYNPDGSRFVFLHRWMYGDGSRKTRMLTAKADGSQLRIVDNNGMTSHFIWRDPQHILAFSEQVPHGRGFFLFEDREGGSIEQIGRGVMTVDGHCSYLPGLEWILNDTYPDRQRVQRPYLYHVSSGRVEPLGDFPLPPEYKGEWRCDTHPRYSRSGRLVTIDTPQPGHGRQLHLIDISQIVA